MDGADEFFSRNFLLMLTELNFFGCATVGVAPDDKFEFAVELDTFRSATSSFVTVCPSPSPSPFPLPNDSANPDFSSWIRAMHASKDAVAGFCKSSSVMDEKRKQQVALKSDWTL